MMPRELGYFLKDRVYDLDRFTDSVRRVAERGSVLDPEVVSQMLGRHRARRQVLEDAHGRPRTACARTRTSPSPGRGCGRWGGSTSGPP
jgi:DNA-binding NarL/FixJ family response regulator